MEFKIGDKVLCIKSYFDGTFDYNYRGNYYIIDDIIGKFIYITSEGNLSFVNAFIIEKDYDIPNFYVAFSDYFTTVKEERRLKLNKINKRGYAI